MGVYVSRVAGIAGGCVWVSSIILASYIAWSVMIWLATSIPILLLKIARMVVLKIIKLRMVNRK